ncbi:TetR/AcrR family transcriptional regulator [Roseateles sp. NT4]|uniref:TetR/AcrR family transcriptional regulator n=1 Tax=Roseateles sp. NT4 TaxID=3453715 RepID=UPI003EEA052A
MSTLKPRKQPTQPRAVETVACILEAAAQILEAQGFEAFNTNAVAERAGVSIGSLYQYFPGKDALLIALMQREKERFRDDANAALAQPDGRAALRHLISAAVRQQLDRAELARLLDLEEEKPETRRALDGESGFSELIRRVLEMPGLPPQADIAHAADDIGQLIRALTDAAGLRGDNDAAALEKRLCAAVFGYLGAAQM